MRQPTCHNGETPLAQAILLRYCLYCNKMHCLCVEAIVDVWVAIISTKWFHNSLIPFKVNNCFTRNVIFLDISNIALLITFRVCLNIFKSVRSPTFYRKVGRPHNSKTAKRIPRIGIDRTDMSRSSRYVQMIFMTRSARPLGDRDRSHW